MKKLLNILFYLLLAICIGCSVESSAVKTQTDSAATLTSSITPSVQPSPTLSRKQINQILENSVKEYTLTIGLDLDNCDPLCIRNYTVGTSSYQDTLYFFINNSPYKNIKDEIVKEKSIPKSFFFVGGAGGLRTYIFSTDDINPKLRAILVHISILPELDDYLELPSYKAKYLPKNALEKYFNPKSIYYFKKINSNYFTFIINYNSWLLYYYTSKPNNNDKICIGSPYDFDTVKRGTHISIWSFAESTSLDTLLEVALSYRDASFFLTYFSLPSSTYLNETYFTHITDSTRVTQIVNELATTGCTGVLAPPFVLTPGPTDAPPPPFVP
jgi:hypothetical protein